MKKDYYQNIEIDSLITFNGKEYYRRATTTPDKKTSYSYFRVTEENEIVALHDDKIEESVQIRLDPELGEVWYDADSSWKFEATSLTETFKTPWCEFDSLLEVKCTPTSKNTERISYKYCKMRYKKGVGQVALFIEERPWTFLKTTNAFFYTPAILTKCKNYKNDEGRLSCASKHIGKRIQKSKIITNTGRVEIAITVDTRGNISEIQFLNSTIDNIESYKPQLLKELQKLDFEPAREYGIPRNDLLVLPLNVK